VPALLTVNCREVAETVLFVSPCVPALPDKEQATVYVPEDE
jgi:hypothetical protein